MWHQATLPLHTPTCAPTTQLPHHLSPTTQLPHNPSPTHSLFSHYFLFKMVPKNCSHINTNDRTHCQCPIFIPKANQEGNTVNICDGCMHSIAWHCLEPEPTQSTSQTLDQILSTYAAQAAASSTSTLSVRTKKPGSKASTVEAQKEAVAGLQKNSGSWNESSTKVC